MDEDEDEEFFDVEQYVIDQDRYGQNHYEDDDARDWFNDDEY